MLISLLDDLQIGASFYRHGDQETRIRPSTDRSADHGEEEIGRAKETCTSGLYALDLSPPKLWGSLEYNNVISLITLKKV
jgi:hypothetical protein